MNLIEREPRLHHPFLVHARWKDRPVQPLLLPIKQGVPMTACGTKQKYEEELMWSVRRERLSAMVRLVLR